MQIVGIEGQNPSGHYLTLSKLIDSVPLVVTVDADLPPAKRQNLDQEVLAPAEESRERSEVSFVSIFSSLSSRKPLIFLVISFLLFWHISFLHVTRHIYTHNQKG